MTTYRLMRWLRLSGELDQLKFRKALTVMSVGRVTDRQLRDATGLRRTEVALLLRVLATAGALDIEPHATPPPQARVAAPRHCDIDLPMEPCMQAWTPLARRTLA